MERVEDAVVGTGPLPPASSETHAGEEVVSNAVGCARCHGEGHEDIVWKPFTYPVELPEGDFTHWGLCPTTLEPILMRVVEFD